MIYSATPGRLAEHIKQSSGFARHHLSTIKHLVLDEVDRMLSLEFSDDLDLLLNLFQRPAVGNTGKTFLEKRTKAVAESNPKEMEKGKLIRFFLYIGQQSYSQLEGIREI